jgi:predicted dehydrogenase
MEPNLRQTWPLPSAARPIVLIGSGGIVNDAHLPAYRKAGFGVAGVFDVDRTRAEATATKWEIPRVFGSLAQAVEQRGVVFDVAVPPEFEFDVVSQLPEGATALLQKPMGADLADARRIRDACRQKKLTAAVNFQLRFAPMMLAAKEAVDQKLLGELVDVEFHLNLRTPWEIFPFLKKLRRCEILVHSVHYLDLCRHLLGEPQGVYARSIRHPSFPDLASVKTTAILDYGDMRRCALSINHVYEFGPDHECADVSIQGTKGAVRISLGLLLNYPTGKPETLEMCTGKGEPWQNIPVQGRWFPDGFVGTMSNLQRFTAGEDDRLVSSFEDAYRTMALVEACYASDADGATPIPE